MSEERGSIYTGTFGLLDPEDVPQPDFIVVPEGAFARGGGVYDVDQHGNWCDLPEEEQEKRRDKLKARLDAYAKPEGALGGVSPGIVG